MGRFLNIVVCHLKSTTVPKYSGRSGKYVACCPVVILECRTALWPQCMEPKLKLTSNNSSPILLFRAQVIKILHKQFLPSRQRQKSH